jgi:hypothetical protein
MPLMVFAVGVVPCVGEFVPPAEMAPPFRRDRIPLEATVMQDLSSRMVAMADALDPDTAAERRGAAQMLALARALDPTNPEVPRLIEAYREGNHQPPTGAAKPDLAALERHIDWLASEPAGADAAKLAACLKDVLVVSAPTHPRAGEWKADGESAWWAGWVPVEGAYLDGKSGNDPADEREMDDELSGTEEPPDEADGGDDASEGEPRRLLESASVQAVMLVRVPRSEPSRWLPGVAAVEMESRQSGDSSGQSDAFELRIGPRHAESRFRTPEQTVMELLKSRHGTLPAGWRVGIAGEAIDELPQPNGDRKDKAVTLPSAAFAVLADAAITGAEPDAIVLGEVDENGAYTGSPKLWGQLRVLMDAKPSSSGPRRLVLPDDAKPLLPSVFAYGKPSFFMDYEVVLAANVAELVQRAARQAPEAIAAPLADFTKIRKAAEGKDLRGFVINKQVNQQLLTIAQAAPFHFSARALTLNPNQWPREPLVSVVAMDLAKALEPIGRVVSSQNFNHNDPRSLDELGVTIHACEESMKTFEVFQRYTTGETRALLGLATESISELSRFEQSVEGAMRKRRDDSESRTRAAKRRLDETYASFQAACAKVTDG